MNILYVQDTDWIEKNPIQHNHLSERLVKKGHKVRVVDFELFWKNKKDKKIVTKRSVHKISRMLPDAYHEVIRPPVIQLPFFDYASMFYFYKKEIKRQIEEFKPDVLIGDGIITPFIAFKIAKKHNIKTMYYCIDLDYKLIPQRIIQSFGKIIESYNIRIANRVVSINEGLRDYTIRMGAKRENTEVVRAGIDTSMFNTNVNGEHIREKFNIKDSDTLLFFVGWLYHFAGLKEVIKDLAEEKREDLKLLIVGDGDAYDDLQNLIKRYRLESSVFMVGKKPYKELPEFLAAADICLLPAYNNEIMRDIVPIKMYEYMAMNNPVIATKLTGLIKEFDYNNGVTYIEKPEEALTKIFDLIDNEKIEIEGEKARRFVENNSWEKITDTFESIMEEIL
jgi:glycosyltransferase involved in cell wall biosynthesis